MEAEFRRYLDCGILANGFLRESPDDDDDDEHLPSPSPRTPRPSSPGPVARAASVPARARRAPPWSAASSARSRCTRTPRSISTRAGLERLLRYACRPPLAQRRLSLDTAGRVHYRLRRPYYTGQTELALEPVDFLRTLAALVPPPRQNQVRFYGLLAPRRHDRERFEQLMPIPPGPADDLDRDRATDPEGTGTSTEPDPSAHRASARQRWATLLKRVFQTDAMVCPTCNGPRRILAAITERDPIHTILTCLGLST